METEFHIRLFKQMLRIRRVEEKIASLYPDQEMRCPVHLSIGQEAIAVGVCALLSNNDYVLSSHRSHSHYLAKGGNLKAMLAELYGKTDGCSMGKGGSMHLVDISAGFLGAAPIVGSTIPIAVGVAFGSTMQDESKVTVVFFGDGATEEGVFCESLNFAGLKQLPVIFVCENNLYSVYSPLSVRQPDNRDILKLVEGHGIPAYHGDGNNVYDVFALADKAISRARHGQGPTFLEFQTYRWLEHCGPYYDNDLGYRQESEFEVWQKLCPVERLRQELKKQNIGFDEENESIVNEIDSEIEEAVKFAQEGPFPEAHHLATHVYV